MRIKLDENLAQRFVPALTRLRHDAVPSSPGTSRDSRIRWRGWRPVARGLCAEVSARSLVLATAILSFCGCVPYPIYKTLQPDASVTVIDQQGRPLSGATVTLISSAYPYGFEKFRVSVVSRNGHASFYKVKDFRVEAVMLHGAESYFWNWCVYRDGFRTIETSHRSGTEFEREPTFILEPGQATACAPPDRLY